MMPSLIPMDVAPVFVDTALRAVLLLGLAGLVTLALWRASAATRHLVWTLALVGVLAVPALRLTLPPLELPLPVAFTESDAVPVTAEVSGEAARALDPGSAATSGAENADAPAGLAVGVTNADGSTTTAGSGATSPAPFTTPIQAARAGKASLPALPLVIWLLGVFVLLLPLAAGWIGLHRLARRSQWLDDTRIRQRARELARRLELKRSYRLLASPTGSMPMTFGLFRATIVLPSDATRWSTSTLDAVLLHELAHVARRDTATQLLAELVRALHWFNPLAWLAARRLRVEREHACDDMALAAGPRPSEYADELLKLVRSYRRSPAPVAALAMARRRDVSGRLRAVLDESRRRNRVRGAPALSGALIALVVVLACTAAAPVPAGSSTPADSPVPRGDLDLVGANHPLGAGEIVGEIAFVGDIKLGGDVEHVGEPGDAGAMEAPGQAVTCIAEARDWNTMQIQSRNGDKHIRMRRPGCDFELRMEGDIQFDAYEMTIREMGSNARLRIEEDSRGTDHSLDIRVGRDGAPVYAYERDGRDHEFDSGAQAWFAATLRSLFRETGFMADARVEALLRVGGVEAVLRELGQVQRSHVFASYTRALLEQARLDEAQLRAVVRSSARRVESDHYMAGILQAVAAHQQLDGGLLDDYLTATTALDSDHYRSEALRAAIDSDRLTGPQIEQVLRAAGTMDSDHYRSGILAGIADRYALEPGFRTAYLEATASMDSDHYRSQVLGRLLERGDLSPDDKAGVLRATAMIDSDHYRSQLLRQVAGRGIREPGLQRAFFDVAAGLGSDHYYRQSLTALLEQGVDAALLVRVLDSAATEMDSDHYLSELLLSVLNDYPVQGAVRDAFLRAMDSMDSRHYRSRVADALLRGERQGP